MSNEFVSCEDLKKVALFYVIHNVPAGCDCYYLADGSLWVERFDNFTQLPARVCTHELNWKWDNKSRRLMHRTAREPVSEWIEASYEYKNAYLEYLERVVSEAITE